MYSYTFNVQMPGSCLSVASPSWSLSAPDFALVTLVPPPTPPHSLWALLPFEEGNSHPLRKQHQNKTRPVLHSIPLICVVRWRQVTAPILPSPLTSSQEQLIPCLCSCCYRWLSKEKHPCPGGRLHGWERNS